MSKFNFKPRYRKAASYEHLYAPLIGKVATSALLMPSSDCNDVKFLAKAKIISPRTTYLLVVERDPLENFRMERTLNGLGWHRGKNLTNYCCPLHQILSLPEGLGIISIDLLGSLLLNDAQWIADVVMPALTPSSVAAVTLSSVGRNNHYIKEFWDAVSLDYPVITKDFIDCRKMNRVIYQRPALWLKVILHRLDFALSMYAYNDSPKAGGEMLAMRLNQFVRRSHPSRFLSQAVIEQSMDLDRVAALYARQTNAEFQSYALRDASQRFKSGPATTNLFPAAQRPVGPSLRQYRRFGLGKDDPEVQFDPYHPASRASQRWQAYTTGASQNDSKPCLF